jgi:hypothetical protein
MGRMANVGRAERVFGDPANRKHAPPAGEPLNEPEPRLDLRARRTSVRERMAKPMGMRRHDVPQDDGVRDAELVERPLDDRRADLRRPRGPSTGAPT